MSTYEQLRGARLKFLDQDPANATDGQVWYNSTTGKDRVQGIGVGAWVSSTVNPVTTRDASGFGIQTAAVIFGGSVPTYTSTTNEYNGLGFTTVTSIPTAIAGLDSDGPQTAGLTAGGSPTPNQGTSFDYDGTSWTANPSLNVNRTGHALVGNTAAQTAAIAIGGENSSPNTAAESTSEYDGSSWTAGATNPGWAQGTSGGGTTSAAFVNANVNDADATANYDGTSWSAGTNSNDAHNYGGAGGLQTAGIVFAGLLPPATRPTSTELYDGTAWTTTGSLSSGRSNAHGKATVTAPACLVSTGNPGPPGSSNITEEFNFGTTTVTAAAWASGGNLSQARTEFAAAQNSTQNAGLVFGGFDGSTTIYNATEEYDGSAWSSGGNLPQGLRVPGGAGTQTAGLSVAGRNGPSPTARINNTYEYDGSTWTDGGNYPATQAYTGALGTQSTALAFGGENPSGTDLTTSNHYDGSTWTAGGTLNTAGYNGRGFGSSTSALCAFRAGPPTGLETESYDGSTWTSVNSMNQPTVQGGSAGSYPNGIAFGGATPGTNTEGWDGTNWSSRPAMSTARRCEGFGTETAGVATGGETPSSPTSATTEEFTPESTTANPAQSLTTSS